MHFLQSYIEPKQAEKKAVKDQACVCRQGTAKANEHTYLFNIAQTCIQKKNAKYR